jgi:peptide deformylase
MTTIINPASDKFPLLEMESQPCSLPISDTDAEVIGRMNDVLDELGDSAVGLAAVQIGYPKKIFLLRVNGENEAFINPMIVSKSKKKRKRPEACLSIPGFNVTTKRPRSIILKWFDVMGKQHEKEFRGFLAQAVSHEMDHLNGVLVTHHMQEVFDNMVPRTTFGMKLTKQKKKEIARRRAKKKRNKRR